MIINYTIDTGKDHIHVGTEGDGMTVAISMLTGAKCAHVNPLAAITQVIGSLTPAAKRELLRVVADRA